MKKKMCLGDQDHKSIININKKWDFQNFFIVKVSCNKLLSERVVYSVLSPI